MIRTTLMAILLCLGMSGCDSWREVEEVIVTEDMAEARQFQRECFAKKGTTRVRSYPYGLAIWCRYPRTAIEERAQ